MITMLATVNTKKYNVSLFPQDYAYDLVATLDIFLPLKYVMEIVQSIHCKPWKPEILMNYVSYCQHQEIQRFTFSPGLCLRPRGNFGHLPTTDICYGNCPKHPLQALEASNFNEGTHWSLIINELQQRLCEECSIGWRVHHIYWVL